MNADAAVSSHPIIVPLTSPDEINEAFDIISYSKVIFHSLQIYKPFLSVSLSNAMHSSIGQNIKSHAVSDIRCPFSGQSVKTSNGHNSATRHPIPFMFGSRLEFLARIALFNLTAHELHELYCDRPIS